jgi:hypothetical protein
MSELTPTTSSDRLVWRARVWSPSACFRRGPFESPRCRREACVSLHSVPSRAQRTRLLAVYQYLTTMHPRFVMWVKCPASRTQRGGQEGQSSNAPPGPSRGKEANGRSPAQEMGQLSPFSQAPCHPCRLNEFQLVEWYVLYCIQYLRNGSDFQSAACV